jgi:hypothetical protein
MCDQHIALLQIGEEFSEDDRYRDTGLYGGLVVHRRVFGNFEKLWFDEMVIYLDSRTFAIDQQPGDTHDPTIVPL